MSATKHKIFVLDVNGNPLTPTTSAKARKLLKGHVAKKVWSKFNTFGIQMLIDTRKEVPDVSLGIDLGTKYEGYSVVCGKEHNFNVNLILPNKKNIVRKLEERSRLRRTRRSNLRRRKARFNNRSRKNFIAPSQLVMISSRLKVIRELLKIYPVKYCGFEDVCFNHFKNKWGRNFSTIEIGKTKIKDFIKSKNIELYEYKGWETKELRELYNYKKISNKSKTCFEAHCSDALTLAVNTTVGERIEPNLNVCVVNDFYRPVRRKLYDTQYKKGNVKDKYSTGTVRGIQKGTIVGFSNDISGQLIGQTGNSLYIRKEKRQGVSYNKLSWINN